MDAHEKDAESPGPDSESSTESGNSVIPSYSEQCEIISPILRPALVSGDAWYLLDLKWYQEWQKYVGYDKWSNLGAGLESNRPGPINLSALYSGDSADKVKDNLVDELDYFLVPAVVWEKLVSWYGLAEGQTPIKRHVVEQGMFVKHCRVEVYLMPLKLLLNGKDETTVVCRHFSRANTVQELMDIMKDVFNIDSETDCRVWNRYISSRAEELPKMDKTLLDSGLYDGQMVMIEPKNADGTWPMGENNSGLFGSTSSKSSGAGQTLSSVDSGASSSTLSRTENSAIKSTATSAGYSSTKNIFSRDFWSIGGSSSGTAVTPGLCGLSNLGNTCFMNSALQCLSNTPDLTSYFLQRRHQKELNRDNPLGMKGLIATAYGDLLDEMWNGKSSVTAPRNFKFNVGKFAPQFSGYAQHDSQELLAFLLDGLHEDLNRIKKKPFVELKSSDGRPDEVVSKEAWDNHLKRNDSVIVDTFQGQFKSTLVCPDCKLVSVTFDPFMYLQVPLPIEKKRFLFVTVVRVDLSIMPLTVRVSVPKSASIGMLSEEVARVCDLQADRLVFADVYGCRFHRVFKSSTSVTSILDRDKIYAYEQVCPVSSTSPSGKMALLYLYHRREKRSTYGGAYTTSTTVTSMELFGFPQVLTVPRQETKSYAALYSAVAGHLHPLLRSSCANAPSGTLLQLANHDEAALDDDNIEADENNDNQRNEEAAVGDGKQNDRNASVPAFNMCFVNTAGSYEISKLSDSVSIKLASENYMSLNWSSDRSKDMEQLFTPEQHGSCNVTVKEPVKSLQLEDCLELFLTREQLGANDPWYCPRCKEDRRAFKKFDLWKLPKVLVIQLKRFSYNSMWRDKIDAAVRFPVDGLDLSGYSQEDDNAIYDLHAVSNHYGGMGGGHYTAYAKNKGTNEWYHFDDSSVRSISPDVIQSRAAYVLFYTRRDGAAGSCSGGE